ncbi:AfsR/SARP family transcriptional regulator [Nocardia lijiangensis]|uniref:AfsR/SARP family transcriptional regulator n=1 Tax=Nocardia lijiangensis TaxID=299618 RepID=UPI003D759F5B
MRWQVSVLGPVEARAGSTVIAIPQPKSQALLAMIAVSGRTVSITELIDGIWGANSPDSAIGAVRNLVWSVRRQLAVRADSTDIVASVPGGYHLAIPVGTDAAIAESHREAAESACTTGRFTEAKAEVDAALRLWRCDCGAATH